MKKHLSAPKVITFWIAVILMAVGIVAYYTDVIDMEADTAFLLTAAGGVLLTIGCWFKGI
jgi:predicted membrane channel-forming protein YqfA (hemolysin III family)